MQVEESIVDKIRSRPRFKLIAEITPEAYSERVRSQLSAKKDEFAGNVHPESAVIAAKSGTDSYWKPRLSLNVQKEGSETVIRGVFGPSAAVWTFFMFLYFAFGIMWMVFVTLWFVGRQIKIEDFTWALPVSFVMLLLIGLVYLASLIGQKKAKPEMDRLRSFALDTVSGL